MSLWRTAVKITSPIIGGVGVNTWHLRNTGDDPHGSVTEVPALMDLVKTFYTSMATYSPSATSFAWDGSAVAFQAGDVQRDFEAWSVPGGSTTAPLPPANVICVGWRTGIATRRGRGRTFFGPLTLDVAQSDGTVNDAALAAMRDAAAALVSDSEGFTNGAIGIWSHAGSVFHDLTSSQIRDKFAVLRSRRD